MDDGSYPALYRSADRKSLEGQRDFLRSTRARLALLLTAAAAGVFTWKVGNSPTDWAGVTGAVAFSMAALLEIRLLTVKPDQVWYDARAVAESVKTLTWRYISGGRPFPIFGEAVSAETDALFLDRISQIVAELKRVGLSAPAQATEQITDSMRQLRSSDLESRRSRFRTDRIEDQRDWYARKATWNDKRATRWSVGLLLLEGGGVVAGVLRAVGVLNVDLLGLLGVIVAAAIAWLQTKQHVSLSRAYTVASHELAAIASRIHWVTSEEEWADFVDQSEEAISREHTMWRASHS